MSYLYLEFSMGNISPCSFTFGGAFHCLPKPPISCFVQVTARVRAIAHMSCQGLQLHHPYLEGNHILQSISVQLLIVLPLPILQSISVQLLIVLPLPLTVLAFCQLFLLQCYFHGVKDNGGMDMRLVKVSSD